MSSRSPDDRDAPRRSRVEDRDFAPRGFGGSRFGRYEAPVDADDEALREQKAPFGGGGWQRFEAPAALEEEDVDDESRGRRKKPAGPTHPRKTVAALGATVRVVRDDAGVPHIAAKSERDAFAALGFCMADDRLWQMDLLRRLAVGRAAEILGPRFLHHDALVRTAGIARRAAFVGARLPGGVREILAAFTAGVNAARADSRPAECQVLSVEIEPWTIADTLAIEILHGWAASIDAWFAALAADAIAGPAGDRGRLDAGAGASAGARPIGWREAVRALDPAVLESLAAAPLDLALDGAGAAVHPAGAAVVAGTLDLAPMVPALAYLAHLETPTMSLAGVALLGGLMFPLGRNRSCAWSASGARVDEAQAVAEEVDGIGGFRSASGWEKLAVRHELIRVRGAESAKLEVAETRNGPLLSLLADQLAGRRSDARQPAVAFRWGAGLESGIAGWHALARARSIAEVAEAAQALVRGPIALSLVAGDAGGGIGMWSVGAAASRATQGAAGPGSGADQGSAAATDDAGLHAEAEATLAPVVATFGGRSFAPIAGIDASLLGERLVRAVGTSAHAPAAALQAALADAFDPVAAALAPRMVAAARGADADAALAPAIDLLEAWDHVATPDSAAAALYALAIHHFLPLEIRGGAPPVRRADIAARAAIRIVMSEGTDGGARTRALLAALRGAVGWLTSACGADPASWSLSAAIDAQVRHPLADHEGLSGVGSWRLRAAGSPFAARRLSFRGGTLPLAITSAPAARMLADLATDEVVLALAGGASGRADSTHFLDLADAFLADRGRTIRLASTEVEGAILELVAG